MTDPDGVDPTDLAGTLGLERIDNDLFRSVFVQHEEYSLYGGLVAAQALAAAGSTVPEGRLPQSLHGYFLRPGNSERPTLLRVERDRDGRTASARRVVAVQEGKVIFSMAAWFGGDTGDDFDQDAATPDMPTPEDLPEVRMKRYHGVEVRAEHTDDSMPLPKRFWVRARKQFPTDDLLHACGLVYVSDLSTGVRMSPGLTPMASVDHAVWIHRVPRVDEWLLVDLVGQGRVGRRGFYTGSIFDAQGRLLATLAQEMLVRRA